jgi:hypothetical protein
LNSGTKKEGQRSAGLKTNSHRKEVAGQIGGAGSGALARWSDTTVSKRPATGERIAMKRTIGWLNVRKGDLSRLGRSTLLFRRFLATAPVSLARRGLGC